MTYMRYGGDPKVRQRVGRYAGRTWVRIHTRIFCRRLYPITGRVSATNLLQRNTWGGYSRPNPIAGMGTYTGRIPSSRAVQIKNVYRLILKKHNRRFPACFSCGACSMLISFEGDCGLSRAALIAGQAVAQAIRSFWLNQHPVDS